ncbi:hypothetical protein GN956_G5845 [Arapaima gigas]
MIVHGSSWKGCSPSSTYGVCLQRVVDTTFSELQSLADMSQLEEGELIFVHPAKVVAPVPGGVHALST